ncbi:hypothetical protein BaRGS_00034404 [Batillaria attramentaria]|uniref:Myosin motor domain-containing protein n=1 Tax=Batillaria attramentaria TaxID=370345 RepID=A0ABD0JHD3_9CAEN
MAAEADHGMKRKLTDSLSSQSVDKTARGGNLCKGQAVYVRSTEQTWVAAVTTNVNTSQKTVSVQIMGTDQVVDCGVEDVLLRSEKPLHDCTNLTQTPYIHERFLKGHYYTCAGTTVVAVNPFTDVSHLYTRERIQAYHTKNKDLPPHIYQVAESAYTSLVRELGKTVSTKHLLKYLTIVSNPEAFAKHAPVDTHKGGKIEQRILDSNPILEAFGNAATPRNINSSRFGKFIELQFMRMGHIQGGAIQTYLLEKTRVVHQGQGENNFHVFYQMTGLSLERQYPVWLQKIQKEVDITTFSCVPHNQECQENGDIQETLDAMTDIGLTQEAQQSVFEILLAILHLSNLRFTQITDDASDLDCSFDTSDNSQLSDDSYIEVSVTERALERSCQLLGLSALQLRQTLLHRSIQPGGKARQSIFVKPISIAEAKSRRDCLAMLLYSRLFDWLVSFINHQIHSQSFDNTIGLLDIYGFETFDANSLEQLCINYANERLQQHYVKHFLHHLQAEYAEECIQWVSVDYSDNRPCVDILDGRASIFSLLNEEVYLNRKSNDVALNSRILDLRSAAQEHLKPARPSMASVPSFVVQHYAGSVTYSVAGLASKNRDDVPPDLISLLLASENRFVQELFNNFLCEESPGKKKKTVLTKFKSSLDELMLSLTASDIHYIRCLRPNEQSVPGVFNLSYVLRQLQACGAIETVDICRRGYPARMPYHEFQQRYSIILKRGMSIRYRHVGDSSEEEGHNMYDSLDVLLRQQLDMPHTPKRTPTPRKKLRRRTVLQVVFGGQGGNTLCQQFGRTKLFLMEHQLEQLERERAEVLYDNAVCVQTAWKAYHWRCRFRRCLAAARICRAVHTYSLRKKYKHLRRSTVTLQKHVRGWLLRHRLQKQRQLLLESSAVEKFCTCDLDLSVPSVRRDSLRSIENLPPDEGSSTDSPLERSDSSSKAHGDLDLSGSVSDDSGVMLHEPVRRGKSRGRPYGRQMEPPQKRQRLLVMAAEYPKLDVEIGDGVITRRRIPKHGCRFHTRASVLKYSQLTNRRDLPTGLPDILPPPEGSSTDP